MAFPPARRRSQPCLFVLMLLLASVAAAGCSESSPGRGDDDDDDMVGDDDDAPMLPDAGPIDTAVSGLDGRPSNSDCVAPARPASGAIPVRLEDPFPELPRLDRPLFLTQAPGVTDRFWLIEQPGLVRTFTGDGDDASLTVDLRDRVDASANEAGLLGIAFHPDFADNGEVFLSYTARFEGNRVSEVSRFTSPDDGLTIDPASEEIVFRTRQPASNHNGGTILFGPDGLLYLSLGDGGGANDTFDNGQDPDTVLGAILRIDVDVEEGYGIPPDNPFADGGGAPEIFAWGLRNPWRMSFDRETGTLWAGDVGQRRVEEIDVIERGGNYGWPIREGDECFRDPFCDPAGLVEPVAVYGRDDGNSVTGGYVYRGSAIEGLEGVYVYADFGSGQMWGLFDDPATGELAPTPLLSTGLNVASFAEDAAGELYVIGLFTGIRKIVPDGEGPSAGGGPPRLLSETGCMDPGDPRRPGPGLVPYEPTATLWSDGSAKRRYIAIPNDAVITVDDDGDFQFPVGTVLVKAFGLGGRTVETRLFVRHEDGGWAGYTYAWNEDETDAELLTGSARRTFSDGVTWTYPSRAQCMACHTEAAGRSLGLETAQLDAALTYAETGRTANQLDTLVEIGMVEGPLPAEATRRPALAPYEGGDADVADRARSYLHANCSGCHRPGGPGRGEQDLRFEAGLADVGCGVDPVHGGLGLGPDAALVAPGAPAQSVLLERMNRRDVHRMPPLASDVVDVLGTGLVRDWIADLAGCE